MEKNDENNQLKPSLLKRIIVHSARLPILYIIIGTFLLGLSLFEATIPFISIRIKDISALTDKLGIIFIALASITFLYNFFVFICHHYEQKFKEVRKTTSLIIASIRRSSQIIFILIALNMIISIIKPSGFYFTYVNDFINVIIICAIGWIAVQIVNTFEAVVYQQMLSLTSENSIRVSSLYTKVRIMKNIATVIIGIITGAVILMSFDSVKHVGVSILASAGFITAVIGLSAQKTLFSLFSGLQIAISQPIKIGDMVVIENESGIIEEITFTFVTIKLGDGRRLVVPINYFIEKPFVNWSRDRNSLRSSLHLHVDYMIPIEPLRKELDNILDASKYWDGNAKKLQVEEVTESAVIIRIQISTANPDHLSDFRAEVREKMLAFIREHYPHYLPTTRQISVKPHGSPGSSE